MKRVLPFLVVVGTVATAGSFLARSPTDPGALIVRDSAGVAITEAVGPLQTGEIWRTPARPVLSLGTVDGPRESQLYQVVGAAALPDGGVVVANGGTQELRFYDAAGRHRRTVGGEGGGPGEFLTLESIAAGPDGNVLAWDSGALRLSTYTARGELVRSEQVPADRFRFFPELAGVFADGSLLLTGGHDNVFVVSSESRRPSVTLWRYSPRNGALDSLLTMAGEERFTWGGSGFASRRPMPFGRNSFVAVRGDRVWVADSDRYEVRVHDARGALDRIVRAEHAPVPVTASDREEARRRFLERSGARLRPAMERMAAALPFPATRPAFSDLRVDRVGRTWVREAGRDEGNRWMLFGPEGRPLGTAELPGGLEVLELGPDYVLGLWRDEMEVEHLRKYRLERLAPQMNASVR